MIHKTWQYISVRSILISHIELFGMKRQPHSDMPNLRRLVYDVAVVATWHQNFLFVHEAVIKCHFRCTRLIPIYKHSIQTQSVAAFSHQRKTVLFRTFFGKDADTWAASLSACDCLLFARWPCNVFRYSATLNIIVFNNNNNNNGQRGKVGSSKGESENNAYTSIREYLTPDYRVL